MPKIHGIFTKCTSSREPSFCPTHFSSRRRHCHTLWPLYLCLIINSHLLFHILPLRSFCILPHTGYLHSFSFVDVRNSTVCSDKNILVLWMDEALLPVWFYHCSGSLCQLSHQFVALQCFIAAFAPFIQQGSWTGAEAGPASCCSSASRAGHEETTGQKLISTKSGKNTTWEWGAAAARNLWEERSGMDVPHLPVLPLPSHGASPLLEALSFPGRGKGELPSPRAEQLPALCLPHSLQAAACRGGSCVGAQPAQPLCPPWLGCDIPQCLCCCRALLPTALSHSRRVRTATVATNPMLWAVKELWPTASSKCSGQRVWAWLCPCWAEQDTSDWRGITANLLWSCSSLLFWCHLETMAYHSTFFPNLPKLFPSGFPSGVPHVAPAEITSGGRQELAQPWGPWLLDFSTLLMGELAQALPKD